MRGLPFGAAPRLCPSCWGPLRSVCALGTPFQVWWPSLQGVTLLVLAGVPPAPSLHAVGTRCWVEVSPLPPPPRRSFALSAHGHSGGPALPSPCRTCPLLRSSSSGFCPSLPTNVLLRSPAPALLSLGLLPARLDPRQWGVLASAWRRLSLPLVWRVPCRLGLPRVWRTPRRWGVLPGAPRLWLPSPSSPSAP